MWRIKHNLDCRLVLQAGEDGNCTSLVSVAVEVNEERVGDDGIVIIFKSRREVVKQAGFGRSEKPKFAGL